MADTKILIYQEKTGARGPKDRELIQISKGIEDFQKLGNVVLRA